MSDDFRTADGTALPEPTRRVVHDHSFSGARTSGGSCRVIEVERAAGGPRSSVGAVGRLLFLTATASDPKWDFVKAEFLAAIVSERVTDGWRIVAYAGDAAALMR